MSSRVRLGLAISVCLAALTVFGACGDDEPTPASGDGGAGTSSSGNVVSPPKDDGASGPPDDGSNGDSAVIRDDAASDGGTDAMADADADAALVSALVVRSQMIPAPDGGTLAFGTSVDIDGDRAVVGASGEQAAYVYKRNGDVWTLEARLAPTDGGGSFGASVAISGTMALVGAPSRTSSKAGAGEVYVFALEGASWVEKPRLKRDCFANGIGNPICEGGAFGSTVRLESGRAYVAAPFEGRYNGAGVNPGYGAIYVFSPNGAGGFNATSPTYAGDGSFNYYVGIRMRTDGTTTIATCSGCPKRLFLFGAQPSSIDGGSPGDRVDVSGDRIVVGESTGLRTYEREDGGAFLAKELLTSTATRLALSGSQMTVTGDAGTIALLGRDGGAWNLVKQGPVGYSDGGASETLTGLAWDGTWGIVSAPSANGGAGRVFFFTIRTELVPSN